MDTYGQYYGGQDRTSHQISGQDPATDGIDIDADEEMAKINAEGRKGSTALDHQRSVQDKGSKLRTEAQPSPLENNFNSQGEGIRQNADLIIEGTDEMSGI